MKLYSIDDFRIDKFCIDQYRLDNYRMDGAGGGGTIIDHSTPVTVVSSAYDTSGNGGRKLVRLSNGTLKVALKNSNLSYIATSNGNGNTWQLSSVINSSVGDISMATDGTNTIYIYAFSDGSGCRARKQDGSDTMISQVNIDVSQTAMGNVSIVSESVNNLHAAWASKNSTYPNSFNICYSKSTDGGVTWTAPTQFTTINASGQDYTNPCVVIDGDGKPHIIVQHDAGTTFYIKSFDFTTVWTEHTVYSGSTYVQSNPSADVDGTQINCVWQGYGSTHTSTYHIFYKLSTNNGATWGTLVDVAVGENPSITHDKNNNLYIQYERSGVIYQKKSTDHGATWGVETTIGTGTNVSICSNYDKFTQPLSIWKGASSVLFAGVFET